MGRLFPWLHRPASGPPKHPVPQRTVFNSRTRQYEQVPLSEFQELLKEGKVEAMVCGNCGHFQYGFRLV
jgi:hypothetical protein